MCLYHYTIQNTESDANLSAPVVKYAATALNVRSSVERDRDEAARLDVYGDRIGVFAVQGFQFFGNPAS